MIAVNNKGQNVLMINNKNLCICYGYSVSIGNQSYLENWTYARTGETRWDFPVCYGKFPLKLAMDTP